MDRFIAAHPNRRPVGWVLGRVFHPIPRTPQSVISPILFTHFNLDLVIESHSENMPSLRIDKPFPSLLQHAMSLDFAKMDPTDHGHIPYVVILVRAIEEWKTSVSGRGFDRVVHWVT